MVLPEAPRGLREESYPVRSLAGLSRTLLGIGIAVIVIATAAVIALGSVLRSARDEAGHDATALESLQSVETELLRYSREGLIIRDGDRLDRRPAIAQRLEALLVIASAVPQTESERAVLSELRDNVHAYLSARQRFEQQGLSGASAATATRRLFGDAMDNVHTLQALKRASLERSRERADAAWLLLTVAGVAAAVLLLGGIVTGYAGFRRYVVNGLEDIRAGVKQLRGGDLTATVPVRGPSELRDISGAFNDFAAALRRHRENQTTFIAGVAHDLRSPLGALKMGLEQLRTDPCIAPDSETFAMVALLERQTDRLSRMLDDLREMAQVEAGHVTLRMERHDLRDAARETVELYRLTTTRHRLELSLPSRGVIVWADPARTVEVLGNLVSNAIKYSPSGGNVRVAVEVRGSQAVVSVTDEGVGVAVDQLPDLFQAFQRGRGSGQIAPGSGLGLSVAQRIVNAHGGHIEVVSAQGAGSTFRVCFPLMGQRTRPDSSAPEQRTLADGTART